MVASRSRIHGFDDTTRSSARNVVQYDPNNPSAVRQFGIIIRAVLDEKELLDAVTKPDPTFDEWLRGSDFSKKDKESNEAFAEVKGQRIRERKNAFSVMIQWPGVLSPRIIDLCETATSPLSQSCGATLLSELMKPALFATPRHQDAILADLSRVHQFANSPSSSASPLSAEPTHEETLAFLEAFWLTWKLSADNDVSKPFTFIVTAYKVLRTLTALRTHVDMQLELYHKSDRSMSARDFIDEVSAETRNRLPTSEPLVPARLVDESGGLHAFTRGAPPRRPAIPSNDGGGGRPPFRSGNPGRSAPTAPGLFQRSGIVVACRFCDCFACSNTASGSVDGCSACGGAPPRRDATEGKLRHLNLCKAHARKHGLKTIKGKDLRAILNALIDDAAGGTEQPGDDADGGLDVDGLDDAALTALIGDLELADYEEDEPSVMVLDASGDALDTDAAVSGGLFVLQSSPGGVLDGDSRHRSPADVHESRVLTPAQSRALNVDGFGVEYGGPDGIELRSLDAVGPATASMFEHVYGPEWRRWWQRARVFGRFSRTECLDMTSPEECFGSPSMLFDASSHHSGASNARARAHGVHGDAALSDAAASALARPADVAVAPRAPSAPADATALADSSVEMAGWQLQRQEDSSDEAELRTLLHAWGLKRRDDIIIDLMGISSVAELSEYVHDIEGFESALAECKQMFPEPLKRKMRALFAYLADLPELPDGGGVSALAFGGGRARIDQSSSVQSRARGYPGRMRSALDADTRRDGAARFIAARLRALRSGRLTREFFVAVMRARGAADEDIVCVKHWRFARDEYKLATDAVAAAREWRSDTYDYCARTYGDLLVTLQRLHLPHPPIDSLDEIVPRSKRVGGRPSLQRGTSQPSAALPLGERRALASAALDASASVFVPGARAQPAASPSGADAEPAWLTDASEVLASTIDAGGDSPAAEVPSGVPAAPAASVTADDAAVSEPPATAAPVEAPNTPAASIDAASSNSASPATAAPMEAPPTPAAQSSPSPPTHLPPAARGSTELSRRLRQTRVPVAAGVLRRPDGKLFVTQREDETWHFPGGKFKPGEVALQALAREMNEETGITVLGDPEWLISHDTDVDSTSRIVPSRFVVHVYEITKWAEDPCGRERQAFQWLLPEQIAALVATPSTYAALEVLARRARAAAISATLRADTLAMRARVIEAASDAEIAQALASDDAADDVELAAAAEVSDSAIVQAIAADEAADDAALAVEQAAADGESAASLERDAPACASSRVPRLGSMPPAPSAASALKRSLTDGEYPLASQRCVFEGPVALSSGQSKRVHGKAGGSKKIGFKYVDSPHGHPVLSSLTGEAEGAGVEVGMLLMSVNGESVATAHEAKCMFDKRTAGAGVILHLSTRTIRELYNTDVSVLARRAGAQLQWS